MHGVNEYLSSRAQIGLPRGRLGAVLLAFPRLLTLRADAVLRPAAAFFRDEVRAGPGRPRAAALARRGDRAESQNDGVEMMVMMMMMMVVVVVVMMMVMMMMMMVMMMRR